MSTPCVAEGEQLLWPLCLSRVTVACGSSSSFLLDADRAPRRCTRRVGADILSLILHVTEFLPPPAISEMEWTRDGSLQTTGGPDAGHVCCVCAVAQLCLTL